MKIVTFWDFPMSLPQKKVDCIMEGTMRKSQWEKLMSPALSICSVFIISAISMKGGHESTEVQVEVLG